jgi:lipase
MAQLHREIYNEGEGRPILAVHGVTGHGRRFERLATEVWTDRPVMAVDLRGHGASLDDGPWSFEQHAEDLVDTLDAAGWTEPVDVVGHSFGASIGAFLLARAAGRVRRLVMLDPALYLEGAAAYETAHSYLTFTGFESRAEAAEARYGQLDPSGHWAVEPELEAHLEQGEDGWFRFRYRMPVVVAAWGEMARKLPTLPQRRPVLLVRAGQADVCGPEYVGALREQLGAALTEVELDCGHMVYWERFEDTGRLVDEFLSAEVP